jgi:hypothetical protein
MVGRSGAGVCGVRPRRMLSFSLGVHVTVFQAEMFRILGCARGCIERNYTRKEIYICSDSQAALQALGPSIIMLKLLWES